MKADRELYSRLEDIHFEYERITSVVSILQQFISEGCVDVTGLPKNVMEEEKAEEAGALDVLSA